MKTGAVIVAAGQSPRQRTLKPLKNMGAMTIISRVIANFQEAGVFPIVVVTGFKGAELEKHVAKLGVFCIPNTDYAQTEMFASAVLGLTFIRNKCDRVFFTPADVPLFTNTTLKKLLASKADVVKPVCRGWSGHPILLAGSLVDKVLTYKGPNGLRGAIKTYAKKVQVVEVEDEGVLPVAENRAQYDKLVTINNKLLFRPAVEVALLREDKLFDKDVALLLSMVASEGNVKEACLRVGISYSKAWKQLKALEKNLGFPLLERQPGGEAGGGSRLTPAGHRLLEQYDKYVEAVKKYAATIFPKYFEER